MRHPSAVIGLLSVCWACHRGSADEAARREASPEPVVRAEGSVVSPGSVAVAYGSSFEPGTALPLAALLSNPQRYADQVVTTEGKVERACTTKGCWMEIVQGEDACRVTFKDYGFFVPTDSAGAHARIQGRLATRVVEAAAVEHLEAEGARFKNKKPDGSATEVRLIASAVELRR